MFLFCFDLTFAIAFALTVFVYPFFYYLNQLIAVKEWIKSSLVLKIIATIIIIELFFIN